MNLLLHVCCGPCSTEAIMRLATYNTVLFFYNPNIYPKEEYIRRLEAAQKLA
ncbi:MAG: epoxyqueuosine reductase QueH, partial [Candidatus Woesearchaeota archaeon]